MQVLGDLIQLPPHLTALPLPWWHRAPLGFKHNTNVEVALLQRAKRPIGDLIVSVLKFDKWENILWLECKHPDGPGVIANLLNAVYPLNVALAETATIETADRHHATLICELRDQGNVSEYFPSIRKQLTRDGFEILHLQRFSETPLTIARQGVARVYNGWLPLESLQLAEYVDKHYSPHELERIDLQKAVVSADTERRILRYVFPFKGAKTVTIQHADEPGNLRELAQLLADARLNILSALLRRSGQQVGEAELVAVCEPGDGCDPTQVEALLDSAITSLPARRRARLSFNDGRTGTEVTHVPSPVRSKELRKTPIYISHRFLGSVRAAAILDHLHLTIAHHGFVPIDGQAGAHDPLLASPVGVARLWTARAGVIPISGSRNWSDTRAYLDLAHEIGYLHAQGLPAILLVEEGQPNVLAEWCLTNEVGIRHFAADDRAFQRESPVSLNEALSDWMTRLATPFSQV